MPKLRINDIDLYYESAGEGQPILFIHGLGSSNQDWEKQTPFFSKHFQAITFDLRGHGRSQKPRGPYSMKLFASDTAELIKSLGIAPVHVVGISLGGMIAFQLAVDHPGLIRSLVIANAGPEVIVRTRKDRWQVFTRKLIVRLLGMRKMGEFLGKRLFPKEEQADLRREFVGRWAGNDPRAYLASMDAVVGWSVSENLNSIDVPTLVITADQDYTPIAAKESYVSRMKQAELVVIADSRHALPVERPMQFNEAVLAFLSKQGTS
jgi:pimeloyl-ACP methyl ester carboxylesterase